MAKMHMRFPSLLPVGALKGVWLNERKNIVEDLQFSISSFRQNKTLAETRIYNLALIIS